MNGSAETPRGSSSEAEDDDTIELVLGPVELQLLSEAAAQEQGTGTPTSQTPAAEVQCRESLKPASTRVAAKTNRGFVWLVSIAAAAAVLLGGMGDSAATLRQRAATVHSEPPSFGSGSRLAAIARTDDAAPVRFANPFDSTEMFEFPTGTRQKDAHAAVADLLTNRARERQGALARRPSWHGKLTSRNTRVAHTPKSAASRSAAAIRATPIEGVGVESRREGLDASRKFH
jgi:hypothetical protein